MTAPNHVLQVDPAAHSSIALAEAPEPNPAPNELVLTVAHASANFGELRFANARPPGTPLGYDAAGTVRQAAADGSGPPAGARVVAFGPGAWAQRATFATDSLAVVPDDVDLAAAAAVPLVGLTALRTLRAIGPLLGRTILITGASGGVGRAAIQLARRGGAQVIAAVGSPDSGKGLDALGAHRIVTALDDVGAEVDGIIETVGGASLVACWGLLAPGGQIQSVGWASGEPAVFPENGLFALGTARSIHSFGNVAEASADLGYLMSLLASGELSAEIGWRGPWTAVAEAAGELFARRVRGKIVLDITAA